MVENATHILSVFQLASKNPNPPSPGEKPDHWVDNAGTAFQNPWKSFIPYTNRCVIRILGEPFHEPDMVSIHE
jgi:hypothetical protein